MIGNLVPWARSRSGVSASREPEDIFTELQRDVNSIFDNMWRGFGARHFFLRPASSLAATFS